MARSRPLTRAEQLLIEDNHESQDSQAILDALKAEFQAATYHDPLAPQPQPGTESEGVEGGADHDDAAAGELAASSPRQAVSQRDRFENHQQLAPHESVATAPGDVNNLTGTGTGTIHRVGRELPRTRQPPSRPGLREQVSDDAVIAASSPFGRNANSPSPPHHDTSNQSTEHPAVPIGAAGLQATSMDTSQQSPTQLNTGRDYGHYELPGSSPPPDTLRSHDERERTLQADDTGAVNFGNLSPGVRPSSQVSEDAGFENTRGEWRAPDLTSQQRSSHGYTPLKPGGLLPETPMPPRNPFAVQHNGGVGVPFAGTQLFEQTPGVNSARKLHSPTSSRPSPNILPDTISLNIIETSPLRNRDNVSSPTVLHTSSPSRPNTISTTTKKPMVSPIPEEALGKYGDAQDDMIPESPTAQPLKPHGNRQPQAHYESMKKSQDRKTIVEAPSVVGGIDSDSDDAIIRMRRKKKMEKIRQQTAEEMERVRVQIPTRRELSDSRNRKRRKLSSGSEEVNPRSKTANSDQKDLADTRTELHSSNKGSSLPEQSLGSTKATPRDAISVDGNKTVTAIRSGRSKEAASEEMIPATSPVRSPSTGAQRGAPFASEPDLPPLPENEVEGKETENEAGSSSLPLPRRRAPRLYGKQAQSRRRNRVIASSETNDIASSEPDPQPPNGVLASSSDATVVAASTAAARSLPEQGEPMKTSVAESEPPTSSPAGSHTAATVTRPARTRRRERSPLTPVHRRALDGGTHTSSSLTTLSTPVISEKNTPDTQASLASDQPKTTPSVPSPAQSRKTRARNLGRESREKTPQQATRATKTSLRSIPTEPSSTDELQQSPSGSARELGLSSLRSSRLFKQSIGSTFRGRRLFEGMVFAISMSPDKASQKTRENLEAKIKQAGGHILESGFEELFEPSTVTGTYDVPAAGDGESLSLSKPSLNYGFTALIADNHSRKVKYMQALALGLPCLAYQWATTCLNKGILIDWEPYLLAAGASAVLGNAVRSRCLRQCDAAEARLVEMIEQRPQLLVGEKLLALVDSRTRNEGKKRKSDPEKNPYMFLVQALGPSISWTSTIQQARELLESNDKEGKPYTWLYMDESVGPVESVLVRSEPTGKKRRRSQGPSATWKVGVLSDELMIQSLILGRMAEEDEMYYVGERN